MRDGPGDSERYRCPSLKMAGQMALAGNHANDLHSFNGALRAIAPSNQWDPIPYRTIFDVWCSNPSKAPLSVHKFPFLEVSPNIPGSVLSGDRY
jgi:hypothetical protein